LEFALGASSSFIAMSSKSASTETTDTCMNGSSFRKICLRPSSGALNTMKYIVGPQCRMSAGIATGTVPVQSV
jgi:hypothetical protein